MVSLGAFHYTKDSGNFGRNSVERSVAVSSDRNIRDHLWRWSIFSVGIFRNSVKEFKMTRVMSLIMSIGWPGFM